jgi:hypothetical protein
MKQLYILLLATTFAACGDTWDAPDLSPLAQSPTLTIAQMQAMLDGETVTFTGDHLLGGVVTASDASGNFYRTLVVDDLTGAVEVMAGGYDLHTLYPIGRVVYIRLRGLTLARREGGMYQIGYKAVPSSGYTVDYIGHTALLERHIDRAGMNYQFLYAECAVPQLNDHLLGRLVTVYGLTLRGGGETTWADAEGGYPKDIRATDPAGNWLYINTSAYADFAADTIPTGPVNISGILLKNESGTRYRIKMRDLRDVTK